MSKHYFFYDESEHSRKISYKTVSALNYYDNFIAMIVGWNDSKDDILQRYLVFETAYTDRKDRNGEIKSTMLSQKQFQYGFASLNKQNAQFVSDFLSLFDETNHVYFSVSSKIEYLVLQLFQGYNNNLLVDADLMKYSITKALVIYRPQEIIRCLYESPERFIEELKTFFQNRIDINKNHSDLKQAESKAFQDILLILEDISDPPVLDWDYHMPFDGFTKYLKEAEAAEIAEAARRKRMAAEAELAAMPKRGRPSKRKQELLDFLASLTEAVQTETPEQQRAAAEAELAAMPKHGRPSRRKQDLLAFLEGRLEFLPPVASPSKKKGRPRKEQFTLEHQEILDHLQSRARAIKGSKHALGHNPENCSEYQADKIKLIENDYPDLYRASLK